MPGIQDRRMPKMYRIPRNHRIAILAHHELLSEPGPSA